MLILTRDELVVVAAALTTYITMLPQHMPPGIAQAAKAKVMAELEDLRFAEIRKNDIAHHSDHV